MYNKIICDEKCLCLAQKGKGGAVRILLQSGRDKRICRWRIQVGTTPPSPFTFTSSLPALIPPHATDQGFSIPLVSSLFYFYNLSVSNISREDIPTQPTLSLRCTQGDYSLSFFFFFFFNINSIEFKLIRHQVKIDFFFLMIILTVFLG